jgi:nanoRNase/pAp phosphatase (c-di-AMP/oligoRNAs hydrolase)
MSQQFRLVTRSDFDGLVCAMLLKARGIIREISFVHPKDVQDGKVDIGPDDITTNLPYSPNAHLVFDHHASETARLAGQSPANHIIDAGAASAARVVYRHYGGASAFPQVSDELMHAVDKSDAAQFTLDEILNPKAWVLLNFLMDARTGLGRFREFRVSNYHLMMQLVDYCQNHTIDEILALPDVAERVALYREHEERAKGQLRSMSTLHGRLVEVDTRHQDLLFATNRFMVYALFPESQVSMHLIWGLKRQNVAFAIGKSILNREHPVNIGELCLKYGGGGHANAGTCQVDHKDADRVHQELRASLR